jgi:hypothetical protein
MDNKEATQPALMIMDINLLPAEYKDEDTLTAVRRYEKDFNVKIIPVDGCRLNGNVPQPICQLITIAL